MNGSKQKCQVAPLGMWTHVCRLSCKQTTSAGQVQVSLQLQEDFYWAQYNLDQILSQYKHFSSGCTRPLQWFCCWSLWGMKGCVHRYSWWQINYHLLVLLHDPPSLYGWSLFSECYNVIRVFSPFFSSSPVHYSHEWSWFLGIFVHYSTVQLLFSFSMSRTASPKTIA